jgi:hypothetical protein
MNGRDRRLLPQTLANARDLGDLPAGDGQVLRRGILLRTTELGHLSAAQAATLTATLGAGTYVDLRSDAEVERFGGPDTLRAAGYRWLRIPLQDKQPGDDQDLPPDVLRRAGRHLPAYLDAARRVAGLLGHGPVIVGCSLGKDRTGLVVAILLHWLGVPDQAVVEDFTASNAALRTGAHLLPPRWREPGRTFNEASDGVCAAVLEHVRSLGPDGHPPASLTERRADLLTPDTGAPPGASGAVAARHPEEPAMTTPSLGSDDSRRRAATLLTQVARDLVRTGTTPDTIRDDRRVLPDELATLLRATVALPDRSRGWSVTSGLLDAFHDAGPTPATWKAAEAGATRELDVALMLVAMSIGTVFGWTGQQDGRMVHNIVPSAGYEHLQVGASSTTELAWHTEDAFHPARAHLLLLACVRNPDRVGTRVASVRQTRLDPADLELLGQPNVVIVPDDSYPAGWSVEDGADRRVRTIWYAEDGPCLRYDPAYTRFPEPGPALDGAYRNLGRELHRCGQVVDLGPGDLLLIDNDVAVHARAAFVPRYDGTDRWLKRVLIRLPRSRQAGEHDGFAQRTVELPAGVR